MKIESTSQVAAWTDMGPEGTPVSVEDPTVGTSSHRPSTAANGTLARLLKRKADTRHSPIHTASCI